MPSIAIPVALGLIMNYLAVRQASKPSELEDARLRALTAKAMADEAKLAETQANIKMKAQRQKLLESLLTPGAQQQPQGPAVTPSGALTSAEHPGASPLAAPKPTAAPARMGIKGANLGPSGASFNIGPDYAQQDTFYTNLVSRGVPQMQAVQRTLQRFDTVSPNIFKQLDMEDARELAFNKRMLELASDPEFQKGITQRLPPGAPQDAIRALVNEAAIRQTASELGDVPEAYRSVLTKGAPAVEESPIAMELQMMGYDDPKLAPTDAKVEAYRRSRARQVTQAGREAEASGMGRERAGARAFVGDYGGGGASGLPSQLQQQREVRRMQEEEKWRLVPAALVAGLGEIKTYASTIEQIETLLQKLKEEGRGTPTGPFEFANKLRDRLGIFEDEDRIRLRALVARLPGLMYAMRGKQLSDKELEVALDMMPKMNEKDTSFITHLLTFKDYMNEVLANKVKTLGAAGYRVPQELSEMSEELKQKFREVGFDPDRGTVDPADIGAYQKIPPSEWVIGDIETDAQGNKAKYLGDGKWQMIK